MHMIANASCFCSHAYSYLVKRLLSLGRLLMELGKLLTLVVAAVCTVTHVSLPPTFPYLAHVAIVEDAWSSGQTTVTVDVLNFECAAILLRPQVRHLLSLSIVISSSRVKSWAIRTRYPTACYNLIHLDSSQHTRVCVQRAYYLYRASLKQSNRESHC